LVGDDIHGCHRELIKPNNQLTPPPRKPRKIFFTGGNLRFVMDDHNSYFVNAFVRTG